MTLKYESEILFDLMKRDGDDTPSDVLPYESELKEKYLQQVEGAYPKLQDYRPEWLNYNLNAYIPADFPVESVSNVTNATFENVVPYAYGSAILSGSTKYRDIDTGDILDTFDETKNLELVSVKMPVLTTSNGGNVINNDMWMVGRLDSTTGGILSGNQMITDFIKKPYNVVEFSTIGGSVYNVIFEYDANKNFIKATGRATNSLVLTLASNTEFIKLNVQNPIESLETHQPMLTSGGRNELKTNILTVNEDVTLRGIGDVQDTLDLMTGEVTERIGEIVLDGSQSMGADSNGVFVQVNDVKRLTNYTNSITCDKLPVLPAYGHLANVENGISAYTNANGYLGQNWLYVRVNNSINKDEIKQWLSQNPITVQYQLATEPIKTVDLTVTDQDGNTTSIITPIEGTMHLMTEGDTIKPLFSGEIPVEATTQNLMSFANILEEE